jgi:hypothetical protein
MEHRNQQEGQEWKGIQRIGHKDIFESDSVFKGPKKLCSPSRVIVKQWMCYDTKKKELGPWLKTNGPFPMNSAGNPSQYGRH